MRCVKGKYPSHLLKLWEDYDLEKGSENDHPKCFTSDQQYIILELDFSGKDLESFQFKNAEQSFSALQQVKNNMFCCFSVCGLILIIVLSHCPLCIIANYSEYF